MGFNFFLALICILNFQPFLKAKNLETYIVHVDVQPGDADSWYNSFLPNTNEVSSTGEPSPRILYRYRHAFSGFAAKLSPEHLKSMQQKKGFISARPERVYQLHTTHSPNFLGLNLNSGFWNISNYGKGVIIGIVDTGITPSHPSFNDEGVPPPPAKWKGKCEFNSSACNNKLIGTRHFNSLANDGTPSDDDGHGTHTAGIAAGNFVKGASIFGNANGTAVGTAPHAHLAIYRVCTRNGCLESEIVAAIDAAIEDGVDILSLSLGSSSFAFYQDGITIGAYRATQKGIFVSAAAGNDGPYNKTLSNEAPWMLTVGASTIDRKIRATVVLGNNLEFDGESAFQPKDFPSTQLELVVGFAISAGGNYTPNCDNVIEFNVTGKIVLCEVGGVTSRIAKGQFVKDAGAAAMILISNQGLGNTTLAEAHVLPAAHISYSDGLKLKAYLNSTSRPTATILFKRTVIGDDRAPVVAGFSSRGPNFESPGILKPDIIGPGVNILAAWYVSVENKTNTASNFNMISGTSMSCPHLSGVAALLKSAHPDWSPAAIKSAIVITADQVNLGGKPIEDGTNSLPANIFATGSGHVNPSRANDPGLVYDIQPDEYIPYLCGLNYTSQQVGTIAQRSVNCSTSIPEAQLNYPSFSIVLGSGPQTYTRTVTNVGEPNESYNVEIVSPAGVNVTVNPAKLSFSKLGQKLVYNVTFTGSAATGANISSQGFIRWNSAKHSVRVQ
ncbi:hypothetical protein DH2020_049115 [Rehmannia glutinosa]|uniref:Uncharacterized protein n=1 Tax=Rehmannia glutinosa TaxID=99300 RepID=A0ABR0U3U8_REHGL